MECTDAHLISYLVHFGTALLSLAFAVLLFMIFPKTDANIEGPLGTVFGELKFKAGGALSGFLIVFIVLVVLTPNINSSLISNACGSPLERWTFSIPIVIYDENSGKVYSDVSKLKKQIKIEVVESMWTMSDGDKLILNYPINPNNITDKFKEIRVEIPDNFSADGSKLIVHEIGRLDISQSKKMFVYKKDNRVEVGTPIIIKRSEFTKSYAAESDVRVDSAGFSDIPEPTVIPVSN